MQKGQNHLSATRLWLIVSAAAALILVTVVLGATLGVLTRSQFREIEASWAAYEGVAERKGALISEIRGYLGYGGIIHNFKNYVLRQNPIYLQETEDQLAFSEAAISEFYSLPLSPDEARALDAIASTLSTYEAMLPIAVRAAREGWNPSRTDQLVRVDDTAAIMALADLEEIWRALQSQSTQRIFAAVGQGNTLIWIGFMSIAALVLAALALGWLMLMLVRDLRGAVRDLGRELAERRKLERAQERLATIVEQSPATIILTDTAARIQYVNAKFEDLTGWTRDEILGQTPAFLQSGDTAEGEYRDMRERLSQGKSWQGVFRNHRKDGSSYWAETTILPLMEADGTVRNFVGIGEDISAAKRAREHVVRAQKLEAVGQLAGGVAHDFNNILTTIVGASHLAALDAPPDSDLSREIEQIAIAARRAQSLVQELLTFARREPGKPQSVDLFEIVSEVVMLLSASVPPVIRIESPEPEERLKVLGDPTHLHQIVMNLCRNAAEALGGTPGIVRVTIARDVAPDGARKNPDGWAKLVVSDDGPGMSEGTIAHLFEPFFTTKPLGKGSGLGLSVVFGLVEDLGGQITVDSEVNRGSTFTVTMPVTSAPLTDAAEPDEPSPEGTERLMLVDDEGEVVGTFRRVLLRLGYQVEAFTSPTVAFERFRADPNRYDLLISDMIMPDMNGEEFATRVRRLRPELPVIFCSGYRTERIALPGPAADVLDKPVDPSVLARHVRTVLDRVSLQAP